MSDAVFEVQKLKRVVAGRVIIANLSFTVRRGEVLFVCGPSGVGKSLLLRCLAYLDPVQDGSIKLGGKTPEQLGVPNWRARVTYVPQSRVQPKGTPSELYFTAQQFAAQRGRPRGDLPALVHELGLEQTVLNQAWTELSGGQSQRVTLAIALALKPEILLLDEAPAGSGGPISLSYISVLLAAALVAVNILISIKLSLGLHRKLAVATVRAIVQLTILGYILAPIFSYNHWWLVLLYSALMLVISAAEAVSRPSAAYQGMFVHVLASIGASSTLVLCYGLLLVIQIHPWYEAQYFIPTLGMLLGNTITGISVGLTTVLDELTAGKDQVELLLSIGASRMEATKSVVQKAVNIALTPNLNAMSVIGLVSIPGMMTGQILGGTSPSQAARYQMVIIFLITASGALSSVAAIFAALLSTVDRSHRVRTERLIPRRDRTAGVAAWLQAQAIKGFIAANTSARRVSARLRVVWRNRMRSKRSSGRGWLPERVLGRRQTGESQRDEYDEVGSISSRLRDVIIGASDDESMSVFSDGDLAAGESGPLLDADKRAAYQPQGPASP
ncbi:hypothetical protein WJX72_008661 [[Myrmecia] bisecta]|uniref:ABC transporter domain-containing protein n=1 Tax=[Myrmecia] bisecta TaxID=41462 RepID=A0AAW1QAZ2_9CHLO